MAIRLKTNRAANKTKHEMADIRKQLHKLNAHVLPKQADDLQKLQSDVKEMIKRTNEEFSEMKETLAKILAMQMAAARK